MRDGRKEKGKEKEKRAPGNNGPAEECALVESAQPPLKREGGHPRGKHQGRAGGLGSPSAARLRVCHDDAVHHLAKVGEVVLEAVCTARRAGRKAPQRGVGGKQGGERRDVGPSFSFFFSPPSSQPSTLLTTRRLRAEAADEHFPTRRTGKS